MAISACMWTCLIWIVFLWWRGVFWLGWRGFMWYYDIVKWFSIIKTHFSICFLFFSLQWNSPTSNIPNFCYLFIYLFFNIYIYNKISLLKLKKYIIVFAGCQRTVGAADVWNVQHLRLLCIRASSVITICRWTYLRMHCRYWSWKDRYM